MGVNFVQIGDEVVVDLRGDTVTPETLPEGVSAHNANGDPITGTMPRSILLDDESTAAEFTNAIDAYKNYGTHILFTINGVDIGTLVYFRETPQKVLYFMIEGQKIYMAAVESNNTVSFERIDIATFKDAIRPVLTANDMDTILNNVKPSHVGTCYMYMGETTEKYTRGSVYRIGEE